MTSDENELYAISVRGKSGNIAKKIRVGIRTQIKEICSLLWINDSFKKIIIVKDDIKPWRDENGILTMGLLEFLTNPNSLEYA